VHQGCRPEGGGKNSTGRAFAPAPLRITLAAPPGAPPRGSQGAVASDPARVPGRLLRSRWRQQFAALGPPFSPGAGEKPAALAPHRLAAAGPRRRAW
jgi:hypothetical protein